jgi:hypothetical protein
MTSAMHPCNISLVGASTYYVIEKRYMNWHCIKLRQCRTGQQYATPYRLNLQTTLFFLACSAID